MRLKAKAASGEIYNGLYAHRSADHKHRRTAFYSTGLPRAFVDRSAGPPYHRDGRRLPVHGVLFHAGDDAQYNQRLAEILATPCLGRIFGIL